MDYKNTPPKISKGFPGDLWGQQNNVDKPRKWPLKTTVCCNVHDKMTPKNCGNSNSAESN